MPGSEIVTPDAVITPGDEAPEWDDPCWTCGSRWDAGPELSRWGRQHCWKCGFAPGGATPVTVPGPEQPDWAALVNDAVKNAMASQPQVMAEAMTAALGREGLADLARQQQEALGMAQTSGAPGSGV